jgi:SAM-dependent methyltransferase
MHTLNKTYARSLVLSLFLFPCIVTAQSPAPDAAFKEELSKQESIYRDKAEGYAEGYVTDRTLADYISALPADFDRTLSRLGAQDRWLDIGAGMGQAILDYYSPGYDLSHPEAARPHSRKAHSVAMSIEDRRTAFWNQAESRLAPGQIRYVYNKRLREYGTGDLGQFQIITDVIGGFSYATDLSLFMEKVLSLLTPDGTFYTVLQDVRSEAGTNKPHYAGASFLTEIRNASGSDVGVCAWLKSISCVEVTCEYKPDWKPPIEVYRVHKTCSDVAVPALAPVHFAAGTPPERKYSWSSLAVPTTKITTKDAVLQIKRSE